MAGIRPAVTEEDRAGRSAFATVRLDALLPLLRRDSLRRAVPFDLLPDAGALRAPFDSPSGTPKPGREASRMVRKGGLNPHTLASARTRAVVSTGRQAGTSSPCATERRPASHGRGKGPIGSERAWRVTLDLHSHDV